MSLMQLLKKEDLYDLLGEMSVIRKVNSRPMCKSLGKKE